MYLGNGFPNIYSEMFKNEKVAHSRDDMHDLEKNDIST